MCSDPDFVEGVTVVTGMRGTSYAPSAHEIQDGTCYWRVAAVDYPHGKRSDFSEIFSTSLMDLPGDDTDPASMPLILSVYPNPASERVALRLFNQSDVRADCTIYDVAGRLVTVLPMTAVDDGLAGVWTVTDSRGNTVPPGVYYARIKAGEKTLKHKIILLR